MSVEHPAIVAANQVLAAIHSQDAVAIRPLLNATNQRKLSDDDLVKLSQEAGEILGDIRRVSELRNHPRPGYVMAKIRVVGGEVFVVVLSQEEGKYLFEDLNSPPSSDYEEQERLAP